MSCCLCPAVLYVNHVQNPNVVCCIITCSSHHIKVLYGLVTNSLHDVSSLHCISFLLQAYVLHATKINNEPIQQHLSLMSQLSLLALAVIFLATRPQVYEHSHAISQILISAWSNKMTDVSFHLLIRQTDNIKAYKCFSYISLLEICCRIMSRRLVNLLVYKLALRNRYILCVYRANYQCV